MSTERALLVGGPHHLTEIEVRTDEMSFDMMQAPQIGRRINRECENVMMMGTVVTYQKRYKTEKGLVIMEPIQ